MRPKAIAYQLLDPDGDVGRPIYQRLAELVEQHHRELIGARIALAWCLSWKPDVDGRVTLGKCKKASDLDRELADYDFIILLRKSWWYEPMVTDTQRDALLDHELCHATVKVDKFGEPARDTRDRIVYRIRKHDIEEFGCIVERYGLYKGDLEAFAASVRRAPKQETLLQRATIHDAAARLGECGDAALILPDGKRVEFNAETAAKHRAVAQELRAAAKVTH